MKFTPRRLSRNVNVSGGHPLRELLVLGAGVGGGLLAVYVALGLALELVVPRVGPSMEAYLGKALLPGVAGGAVESPARDRLQGILDRMAEAGGGGRPGGYRAHLVESKEANAVALPGGHVVVFSGLLREAASENELAMVLGHELGHFRSRDHLRGLGRGLVLVFLSSLFPGADGPLDSLTTALLGGAEMRFSQRQELAADEWGLELLVRAYGHAGGATDFFRRFAGREGSPRIAYFLASHPYPAARVEALERRIEEKGYRRGETSPLGISP